MSHSAIGKRRWGESTSDARLALPTRHRDHQNATSRRQPTGRKRLLLGERRLPQTREHTTWPSFKDCSVAVKVEAVSVYGLDRELPARDRANVAAGIEPTNIEAKRIPIVMLRT